MNAPGKARRERGSLAEYETQVKGELGVVGGRRRRRRRPVGVAVGRLLEWVGLHELESQEHGDRRAKWGAAQLPAAGERGGAAYEGIGVHGYCGGGEGVLRERHCAIVAREWGAGEGAAEAALRSWTSPCFCRW